MSKQGGSGVLALTIIVIVILVASVAGYFLYPKLTSTSEVPLSSGLTVCYVDPVPCNTITAQPQSQFCLIVCGKTQSIVNPQGQIYASFNPFVKVSSNRDGSFTFDHEITIKIIANTTERVILSQTKSETKTLKVNTLSSLIQLAITADQVEQKMDELQTKKANLFMGYTISIKQTRQVITGSVIISNIEKLIVEVHPGLPVLGGGVVIVPPTEEITPSTSDFQKIDCVIPYYYYSSSGIPRLCSKVESVVVQADKTVRINIFASVSCSPNTYGCSGGDIQMRVLDSKGNIMYAGQCLGDKCYIAGSVDNPQYAQSSGVLIGENRAYQSSAQDILAPRRIGGASEIIIFDKGTYSILLIDGGTQVAKKTFMVN